jgi:integrase
MSNDAHTTELDRAIHFAFSRMIGTQGGWRNHGWSLPAVVGASQDFRVTGTRNELVMCRAGLEPKDLDDAWAVARANGQLLPLATVELFYPRAHWPIYARFIEQGPMNGWQAVESVLACWARGLEPDGSRRKRRIADSTVEFFITGVHRFMRELCEVRKLAVAGQVSLDPSVLDGWEAHVLPRRVSGESLGARPADTDRRAPHLRAVRLALRALDRDVQERKKTVYGRRHMGRELRNRALFAVFVTLGGRRGAVMRLKRRDFVRFHRQGSHEGPAIFLRPAKSVHGEVVRVKFLPVELGEWIHEWIEYVGIHDEPDAPLWVRNRGTRERLTDPTASNLIPRLLGPYMPDRRCSPHTLRHLCEQLAFHAGLDWLEENRELLLSSDDISGLPTSPQQLADALLDHAFAKVQDTYKDMNSEQARENWARIAAEGVWSLVWGDKGAPKGPDVALVDEARRKRDDALAEQRRAREELHRIEIYKKVVRQRAIDTAGAGDVGQTLKAMLEIDGLGDEVAAVRGAVAEADNAVEWAAHALKEAMATRVPLPDEAPVPAELIEEIELPAVPGVESVGPEVNLRDRVTLREFHWALSGNGLISEPTLRRWANGLMPHRPGDLRNIWDPPRKPGELPECIHRPTPRKTFVLADKLDLTRFPLPTIERLKYLQTLGEEEVFTLPCAA